jgi:hypothetical protein
MASKWGMILSLIFVFQLLLMTGDLALIQARQAHLQAFATTLAQRIALEGNLLPSHVQWAEGEGLTLSCVATCQPQFGDTLSFSLATTFTPMIISDEPMTLRIVRHTVIGIYY